MLPQRECSVKKTVGNLTLRLKTVKKFQNFYIEVTVHMMIIFMMITIIIKAIQS